MSVVIVVKVSEGLVLGADSAATIQGRVESPEGVREGVLKTFFNARKLLQIGDFPIGVLTWGKAFIGSRTIESLIREWEYKNNWQSEKEYSEHHDGQKFKVKTCAEKLCRYLAGLYAEEFGEATNNDCPIIGFIVAGYSQEEFFPEIWRFVFPVDNGGQIHNQRPDRDGKPDFGAHWFGLTDAIVRLHFGRDVRAVNAISEKFKIPRKEIEKTLQPFEYRIPFAVMPLQDAIEYASYMLNVAIGRYRFVIGPEQCGGQIEIAAITQKNFDWISRKTWSLGENKE